MLSDLIDRDAMIEDLAAWFGVSPRLFRPMDQSALDEAWLTARQRWVAVVDEGSGRPAPARPVDRAVE